VLQLVAHGISTGALFLLAGALQERCHTRDMRRIGGLWGSIPRLSAFAMFFAVASLGLPGLANFVGEFLVLFGAYLRYPYVSVLATLGMIVAAIYSLALLQRIFFGPARQERMAPDLSRAAFTTLLMMAAIQVWLGWHPGTVLSKTEAAVKLLIPSRASESRDQPPAGHTLSSIPAVVPERP
jgi:NADH-quinone oxidoreductase subunit M